MGIVLSWLTPGCCSKVDEKKKISRQIDKEILQELKQEAGNGNDSCFSDVKNYLFKMKLTCCFLALLRQASPHS